jgi:CRISPR-associated protein (TIGR02584 family)
MPAQLDNHPDHPENYPRRVLLAATGLSLQIVTETLYALILERKPSFVPTEIHLITTTEGAQNAEIALLDHSHGRFIEFCEQYGINGKIHFDSECIHLIRGHDQKPLSDIRSPEENTLAANAITALVRELTADPTCAVHVSIAGGRKTMGFYLGYALSLFGRAQDRLSHVLVSEEFESNPGFYFPPPQPEMLLTLDKKRVSTRQAQVTLAEIPFVRLRHGLPKAAFEGEAVYDDAVLAAQFKLGTPELVIDLPNGELRCGGIQAEFPPQLLAFYAWFARRKKRSAPPVKYSDNVQEEFLAEYRLLVGEMSHNYETAVDLMSRGMPLRFFSEKKSRIKTILSEILGHAADPYLIQPFGNRPVTSFGLALAPEQIIFSTKIRSTSKS